MLTAILFAFFFAVFVEYRARNEFPRFDLSCCLNGGIHSGDLFVLFTG